MDTVLGEIRLFSFTTVPRGWHVCDGALLSADQHAALFQLIGFTYGGDNSKHFALPDLRGRAPVHFESNVVACGANAGAEAVALTGDQLPIHMHFFVAEAASGTVEVNANHFLAGAPANIFSASAGTATALAPQSVAFAGGGQAHSNMQPYLVMRYCIALEGIYPNPTNP